MSWNEVTVALAVALVGLIGGISGVIAASVTGLREYIVDWWKLKRRDQRRRAYANGLRLLGEYKYTIDVDLGKLAYIDRLVVFSGQNGGGIPKPGMPFTIRGVYAWSKRGDDLYSKYNFDMKIDADYYKMLDELVSHESIVKKTEDMPDSSAMKSFYLEEKVVCAALYLLNISTEDNVMHYISVASYSRAFTREQLIRIEMAVERLRALHARAEL